MTEQIQHLHDIISYQWVCIAALMFTVIALSATLWAQNSKHYTGEAKPEPVQPIDETKKQSDCESSKWGHDYKIISTESNENNVTAICSKCLKKTTIDL